MKLFLKEQGMRIDLPYGELDVSGNEEYGFRPFQLMVASIAGCSASVYRKILDKQKIDYEDLIINAEVERNEMEANRIESIHLEFVVKGRYLDEGKLYKNLEVARKNCSMIRSVENSINIKESLECIEINS
ncbi:OsmC family protein [Radiobacillus sp. PE A8.2]|uniref:OsmC family protein n=1 Tax=Radiobacillus sp. PE A8.2 TaxID=3380349 RepID=UPI0038907370